MVAIISTILPAKMPSPLLLPAGAIYTWYIYTMNSLDKNNPNANNVIPIQPQKARKQVVKRLSTGQKISLSTQDERTLRSVYDFLAGFATRRSIESALELKKSDVNQLHSQLPPSARLLLQMQPRTMHSSPLKEMLPQEGDNSEEKSENDMLLDQYYKAKEQLHKLEEKLKQHSAVDHRIGFKDMDAMLKTLGSAFSKKQIEVSLFCILLFMIIFAYFT